jgi:hypothetical protein
MGSASLTHPTLAKVIVPDRDIAGTYDINDYAIVSVSCVYPIARFAGDFP